MKEPLLFLICVALWSVRKQVEVRREWERELEEKEDAEERVKDTEAEEKGMEMKKN